MAQSVRHRRGKRHHRRRRRATITTPIAKTSALTPISSGPEAVDPGTSQRQEGPDGATSAKACEAIAEPPTRMIAEMSFFIMTPYHRILRRLSTNKVTEIGNCSTRHCLVSTSTKTATLFRNGSFDMRQCCGSRQPARITSASVPSMFRSVWHVIRFAKPDGDKRA